MSDIQVFRGGQSTERMAEESPNHAASIYGGYPHNGRDKRQGGITVAFGAGAETKRSKFWVWIGPKEFEKLAKEMIDESPKEARRAFLSALLEADKRNA